MQSLEEIKWIREKKLEFKNKFNKTLNFSVKSEFTKEEIEKQVKDQLEILRVKYSVNLEDLINMRIKKYDIEEKLFIKDFGMFLLEKGFSINKYSKFVNRDPSTIKYHLNQ